MKIKYHPCHLLLFAAAVMLPRIVHAETLVIDNTDPEFAIVSGTWTSSTNVPGFEGTDYLHDGNAGGGSEVEWTLPISSPTSQYSVAARWVGGANRATNASFIVSSAAGDELVVVNQQQGGGFVRLGQFHGPTKVTLTNTTGDGYVIADAVRAVRASFSTATTDGPAASALGTDMWTQRIADLGLFRAHEDNCNYSQEVFVPLFSGGDGYCFEINERPVASFEDARSACLAENKRLPEPIEWVYVCKRAASLGIQNMLVNGEWISNMAAPLVYPVQNYNVGIFAATGGRTGEDCTFLAASPVGSETSGTTPVNYRCVR